MYGDVFFLFSCGKVLADEVQSLLNLETNCSKMVNLKRPSMDYFLP